MSSLLPPSLLKSQGAGIRWVVYAVALCASGLGVETLGHVAVPAAVQGPAPHPACRAAVIPFVRAAEQPGDLLLTGRADLAVRRVIGLRVARPELFPFQRLEPFGMRGTMRDGCPFVFWWAGNPATPAAGEIRLLSTVEPLDPDYAYLQLTPDPPPSRTPRFEGYRHIMSTPIVPDGPSYVGLWNRADGSAGSLVASYDVGGDVVTQLGTATRTYEGVYATPAEHQIIFTLVDAPEGTEPLYMVTFEWVRRDH